MLIIVILNAHSLCATRPRAAPGAAGAAGAISAARIPLAAQLRERSFQLGHRPFYCGAHISTNGFPIGLPRALGGFLRVLLSLLSCFARSFLSFLAQVV